MWRQLPRRPVPRVTGAPGDNCPTVTHKLVTAPGPGTLFWHRHRHRHRHWHWYRHWHRATLPLVTAPANVDLGLVSSDEARANQTQVNISPPKFFVGTRTKFPLPNWGSCLCTFFGGGSGLSVNRTIIWLKSAVKLLLGVPKHYRLTCSEDISKTKNKICMQGALFNIKQITLTAQPVKFVLSLCILLHQWVHLSVCVSCLVYPSFQLLEMFAALTVTLIHQCIGALVY